MIDNIDNKSNVLNDRFRMQIDLQQTEEGLRRIRNEIFNLNIQIRKFQQDFSRAKLNLESAQARLKILKGEEFDLSQNAMKQKRAFVAKK